MDGFELNKMAGAVLLAGIIAMATGFLARNLVPEPHGTHGEAAVATGGHAPAGGAAQPAAPAAVEPVLPLLASASAEEGQTVARKCAACHTFEKGGPNRVGPNLYGIIGADKAHLEGFSYSSALANAPGKWTYEDLDKFLAKPSGFLPGTKMTFAGLSSAKDRANILAYMREQSDNPPPLPAGGDKAAAQPAGGETPQPAAAGGGAAAPAQGQAAPTQSETPSQKGIPMEIAPAPTGSQPGSQPAPRSESQPASEAPASGGAPAEAPAGGGAPASEAPAEKQ